MSDYRAADRLNPPMVEVLQDDQWWDGAVQAQELRDGVWWVNVVYRRDGNRVGWFPADQVRPDTTDYSRGRAGTSTHPSTQEDDMPAGDIETFHVDGAWRNRVEAGETYPETYDVKAEAVEVGRDLARDAKVEHIIRNLDGTIGERNTYGHDPRNIPG